MPDTRGVSWRGRVLVAAGMAVLLAATGAGLTYSRIFAADTLVVLGAVDRSHAEILATAGLEPGVNVFHLDPSGPEAALLADPWIAEATVEPDLPSTVTVRIVERVPVAVSGGVTVAADGTELPGADPQGLPTIANVAGGLLDDEARTAAAAAVAALEPAQRRAISAVTVATDGKLEMNLGTVLVRWGMAGADQEKAAALAAVLRSVGAGEAMPVMVDVSVPGAPAAIFG